MPEFDESSTWRSQTRRWAMPIALVVLAVILVFTVTSLARERRNAAQLATANRELNLSLQEMQNEVRTVSDKLNALAAQPPPAAVPPAASPAPSAAPKVRARGSAARRPARKTDDTRWRQMQEQVTEQKKELADTKQQLDQTRQDLQNNLNSTRDELSSSIAKNHDELVILQKRGDRNLYEFDLERSKQFHRVGPLNVSVRSVNQKHRFYDMVMTVEDQQVERKHVSLYEPLMLRLADRPQPVELVVNRIDKNGVRGYISEPKYKNSELASTTGSAPAPEGNLQRR
jgi:flagellar biosynthesis/type III secretory pathway chaperone